MIIAFGCTLVIHTFFCFVSLLDMVKGDAQQLVNVYESFFGNTNLTIFIFLYEFFFIARSSDLDLKLPNLHDNVGEFSYKDLMKILNT